MDLKCNLSKITDYDLNGVSGDPSFEVFTHFQKVHRFTCHDCGPAGGCLVLMKSFSEEIIHNLVYPGDVVHEDGYEINIAKDTFGVKLPANSQSWIIGPYGVSLVPVRQIVRIFRGKTGAGLLVSSSIGYYDLFHSLGQTTVRYRFKKEKEVIVKGDPLFNYMYARYGPTADILITVRNHLRVYVNGNGLPYYTIKKWRKELDCVWFLDAAQKGDGVLGVLQGNDVVISIVNTDQEWKLEDQLKISVVYRREEIARHIQYLQLFFGVNSYFRSANMYKPIFDNWYNVEGYIYPKFLVEPSVEFMDYNCRRGGLNVQWKITFRTIAKQEVSLIMTSWEQLFNTVQGLCRYKYYEDHELEARDIKADLGIYDPMKKLPVSVMMQLYAALRHVDKQAVYGSMIGNVRKVEVKEPLGVNWHKYIDLGIIMVEDEELKWLDNDGNILVVTEVENDYEFESKWKAINEKAHRYLKDVETWMRPKKKNKEILS